MHIARCVASRGAFEANVALCVLYAMLSDALRRSATGDEDAGGANGNTTAVERRLGLALPLAVVTITIYFAAREAAKMRAMSKAGQLGRYAR